MYLESFKRLNSGFEISCNALNAGKNIAVSNYDLKPVTFLKIAE